MPTLLNVPNQPADTGEGNCTILCPNDDNANVVNDINNLVNSGKLSQEDANRLIDLANQDVSPEEYAAALDALVKQGKLTPEQARQLLAQYKKQHQNSLLMQSGKMMDGLIKSGQLPLDAANQLLMLQKSGVTPAEYGEELDDLVKAGKISPAVAGQLLAQYTQQKAREATKNNIFGLKQLARAGTITPDVADQLASLQSKNVPLDQYAAELQRLVAAGKITPAAAAKLLEQYQSAREAAGAVGGLNSLVSDAAAAASGDVTDLVKARQLSQADADKLLAFAAKETVRRQIIKTR